MNTKRAEKAAAAKASAERIAKAHAETAAVVATGKCPECGGALRRNLSMSGWYQCEQLGAVGFRKNADAAPCSWQGFTS